jgi:hypothetical protein
MSRGTKGLLEGLALAPTLGATSLLLGVVGAARAKAVLAALTKHLRVHKNIIAKTTDRNQGWFIPAPGGSNICSNPKVGEAVIFNP